MNTPGRTSGLKPGLMDDRTSLSATDSLTRLRQKLRQKWLQTATGKGFEILGTVLD
ncbi:hypothetical protein QUB56_21750 [Microcoleus sp. AR_TQ3_B6]|uniref:hypothetical protein n=1 Tax=Microcoleus sp. AR_TQ3_B6 TaxID=3055284 RepID=UPI002FD20656